MMVRLGTMDYDPSPIVKPHTLDQRLIATLNKQILYDINQKLEYTESLLEAIKKGVQISADDQNHRKYLQKLICENLRKLKDWFKKNPSPNDQRRQFQNMKDRLLQQRDKIDQNIDDNRLGQGGDWRYQENHIIIKSKILCTTLSMSGIEKLDIVKNQVDYLIIDEACQAIEPSTLVPFELGPKRIIMVGDQSQLPATTISENAERTKFSRSFFERLLDNGYQRYMLNIQYRMDPVIRKYPSASFYENRIQDDVSISTREIPFPIQKLAQYFQKVVFFDLTHSAESVNETSKHNVEEAYFTG